MSEQGSNKHRRFNQSERNALWIAAEGKCQNCGNTLDETWEPDHVHPYTKGGESEILNGQALCRECNRKKDLVFCQQKRLSN